MSIESMLNEGLYLMIIGMGFVIIFLTLLVQILNLMERFIDHDEAPVVQPGVSSTGKATITAVISAAIHKHRQRQTK
ncbi:MAG: hypothetical protein GY781_14650 [Gammaproteobacteria bacterium]|nr:hypothetical protein [Gammaproteobacteria bacterium]